jgi:hypothetical protein
MSPEHRRQADRITVGGVVNVLIGLAFIAGGAWFLYYEVHSPPVHTSHVGIGFGAAVFGALMIRPDAVSDRLKRMASLGRGFLPGARASTEVSAVKPNDPGPSGG